MTTKRTKRITLYMHTIDGRPAQYFPGEQVCFADWRPVSRFAASLRQIRKEQDASAAWRREQGFDEGGVRGYVRLRISQEGRKE